MLEILANNKYKVTPGAAADTARVFPALAKVTGSVLIISGHAPNKTRLSTVSSYEIYSEKCQVDLPSLNKARSCPSACVLHETAYVFCGWSHLSGLLNSIETI